jgi:nitrous oxide reductase
MPQRWLQVKGDPSVRAFLFQQSRVESLFDGELDRIHDIVHTLLHRKGAFHVKVHYSSSQLTCWFVDDAYRYRVYVKEEVTAPEFIDQFRDTTVEHLQPILDESETRDILNEFRRLRTTDSNIYLRNGSINRINGMIGMTFSCDGAHYIDHKTFFEKLETFASPGAGDGTPAASCV